MSNFDFSMYLIFSLFLALGMIALSIQRGRIKDLLNRCKYQRTVINQYEEWCLRHWQEIYSKPSRLPMPQTPLNKQLSIDEAINQFHKQNGDE